MSEIKCQYCNKELKNQGAKNLHELKCKSNPKNKEQEDNGNKNKKGACEKGGDHDMRLLNPRVKAERAAINDGYSEVCRKCGELE
jgi:hypothetical protein